MSDVRQTINPRTAIFLTVLWAALIFATSTRVITIPQLSQAVSTGTGGRLNADSFRHFWEIGWWPFVKGWHAFEFGLLYSLARLALPGKLWLPFVLAGLYAVSDEGHQLFVPNRGCRASDVCIDLLGIFTAWMLFRTSGGKWRSPWSAVVIVLWIAALYWLSLYPFGLVTLSAASSRTSVAAP